MTAQRKTLALLALAVCVSVVAVIMMTQGGSKSSLSFSVDSPAPAAADAKVRSSSESVLTIAPGLKRTSAVPSLPSRFSPLMQEARTVKSYKGLYDRIRANPSPTAEESYLLAVILQTCANVTDRKANDPNRGKPGEGAKERFAAALSPKAPNREKRIAAFESTMRNPCVGLEGLETTEKEIVLEMERAAAAGDAKAQAFLLTRELREARRNAKGGIDYSQLVTVSDAQIDTFRKIVASGDPRALVDVISVFNWNASVHLRGPDEAPIDMMSLYYAATLTACDLGYPCGPDSTYLAASCAQQGQCDAADYRDYLLFYQLAPGNAQTVMQYQAQLSRVIRDGDWSFFTFQPGPTPVVAAMQPPKP